MASPITPAGQALVRWAASDARPIGEYGYDSVAEAVTAAEEQAREQVRTLVRSRRRVMIENSGTPEDLFGTPTVVADGSQGMRRGE